MNTEKSMPIAEPALASGPFRHYPCYHWRRLGRNFLTLSILAHLLSGFLAAF